MSDVFMTMMLYYLLLNVYIKVPNNFSSFFVDYINHFNGLYRHAFMTIFPSLIHFIYNYKMK